ncbi:NACHT and WD40 repeat domain-containing protein [Actinomyces mediterranea]|uniref:NACHT and WD40 repeat domain-containing protein n=1 Tax=Actinomyces mediterranea TaxID=1871028 RepID=UPI001F3B4FF8|nr:NACHT domain-containing protein [Actinomyces mediterranea]
MGKFDEVLKQGRIIEDPRAAALSLDKQDPAPNAEAGRPVLEALMEWVSDPEAGQFFALLGEYGMGKTVTSQRLATELEKRRETDPTLPMPLYFDFKRIKSVEDASSLRSTVETCMRDGWLPKESEYYTWERFVSWLASVPCLVIFDGLDELLVKFDERVGVGFTQQLLGVIDVVPTELRSQTKVMLTCRTQYFPTLRAQRNHFLLRDRGDVVADTYRAMTLLPLTEEQVRTYLGAAVPSIPVDAVMETVRGIHNLSELSERPYTLKLISKQVPELERKRAAGEAASGATLYGLMTEEWLDRDDQKHYIAREHKPRLVASLAAYLWRSGTTLLPVSDLHDWFHEWVSGDASLQRRYAGADIERLEEDLRTATFLSREDAPDEGFRFAHTSLLEYFLALHLAESARRNEPEGWAISVPSRETLTFLGELFQDEYSDALRNVTRWRTTYRPKVSELLVGYALHARQHGLPVPVLRGINLNGAHLDDLVVQGSEGALIDLSGASFVGTSLRRAVFENVNLNRTNFTDARLAQATFASTRHKGALWPVDSSSAAWVAPKISGKNLLMQGGILNPLVDCHNVAVSADGSRVVTGSMDGTLHVWDADTGGVVSVLEGHVNSVDSVALSADGARVVTGSGDSSVRVWDADTGEVMKVLEGHSDAVLSVAVSADGSRVVTGEWEGTARVWDADTGKVMCVCRGHANRVWSVAVSADGSRVVTGSDDQTARVWDADTGKEVKVLEGHRDTVTSVAVSADGSRVVTGSRDRTARVWDADTGDVTSVLSGHYGWVTSVAVSADGSRVVTGSRDGTARVWDADTGEEVSLLEGHIDRVESVAMSTDGARVVTGSRDGTARVWDADTGGVVKVLEGHRDSVWSVAVSADGARVVTGSRDRTARVWDANNGQPLRTTLHTPTKPGYPAGFASWRPGVPMIDAVEGGAWRDLWIRDDNGRVSRPVIPGVSYAPPAS